MGQNMGQGLEDAVCGIPARDGGDRIEEASSGGPTGQIPGSRSLREGVWSLQVGGAVASRKALAGESRHQICDGKVLPGTEWSLHR